MASGSARVHKRGIYGATSDFTSVDTEQLTQASPPEIEGRRRIHPLYKEDLKEDRLYHCPYEASDPPCLHEPTELKCNYEYVAITS